MLSLSINKILASLHFSDTKDFDKLEEYSIHSKLANNSLDSLFAIFMDAFFVYFWISFVKRQQISEQDFSNFIDVYNNGSTV